MDNVEVALRVYGHQHQFPPQVCTDTRLEVPFGKDNHAKIKHRLRSITPKGTSPISYALSKTSQDFPACDNCRNIVVLITDGIEECGGDPCAVSRELQKNGVILKPFIIGIGRNFYEAFNCVGSYFDATSEEKFSQALHVVISRALNPTTAQVNLIDAYGKPTETNVNMTLYDNFSGLVKYNLIHTMNNKGLPDTLMIDPLLTYDMVIHTLPGVEVRNIQLTPGKHNIIAANVPQGELKIKTSTQNTLARNLVCIVRQKGRLTTINVQGFGQTERYLTGEYEIEVLSLPRLIIEDVNITQDHLTTVEIPAPGIAVIQKSTKGYGSLYVEKEGKLEWIYNFRESSSQQESLILLPGDYRAVFRSKYMNRSFYTVERRFTVKSGTTTNVRLDN
jgi:Ca-activated chloride channel family protein